MGVSKRVERGVRTYKNDNASQDGSFYGFSLFLKGYFLLKLSERLPRIHFTVFLCSFL